MKETKIEMGFRVYSEEHHNGKFSLHITGDVEEVNGDGKNDFGVIEDHVCNTKKEVFRKASEIFKQISKRYNHKDKLRKKNNL